MRTRLFCERNGDIIVEGVIEWGLITSLGSDYLTERVLRLLVKGKGKIESTLMLRNRSKLRMDYRQPI